MSGAVDLSGLAQASRDQQQGGRPSGAGGIRPVVAVSEADFEAEVLQRSMQVPVVVSIGSAEYQQCAELDAVLEKAANAAGGQWVLAKVDMRSAPRIAQAFGVQSVPTVIAVAAGRPVDAFAGTISEDEFAQWMDAVLRASEGQVSGAPPAEEQAPERDPRLTAAEECVDAGDLQGGIDAYEGILAQEPEHSEAKAAVEQLRFLQRAQAVPEGTVAAADADPSDVDLQLQAADAELLAQRADAAFDRLVGVVRSGGAEAKNTARSRLLELLGLFDPTEEHVIRARGKLANALH